MGSLIFTVPSLLHLVGFLLLLKVRHVSESKVRYWFLLSLSFTEFLYCFCLQLYRFFPYYFYTYIMMNAVLVTMYAALMHLVLFDRFLEIYLHLRYEIVCTVNRTKVLIVAIFVLLVLSAIPQMVLMEKDFVVIFLFYSSYVWPSISITFLISSISIYAYIYIKVSQFRETTRINHKLGQFSMSTRFETSTRATTNNKSTSNKRHSPLPVTSAPLVRDNGDLGITESKIALEPRSPLLRNRHGYLGT